MAPVMRWTKSVSQALAHSKHQGPATRWRSWRAVREMPPRAGAQSRIKCARRLLRPGFREARALRIAEYLGIEAC
jgi:hypothetical protein